MFDPLPISGFGTYPETSAEDVAAMMAGEGAYAGIDVVLISHAHSDHFSAAKMLAYMRAQPDVKYVMPRQAVDMLEAEDGWEPSLLSRITVVDLGYGDGVQSFTEGDVMVETVRIPHAGWPAPKRAAVQNMVYRVTLGTEDGATIIHMGDADPRRQHFTPYKDHWDERRTDTAFPPYWFQISPEGRTILSDDINAANSIGIHVPIKVPLELESSGQDYFSVSGETRTIEK